MSSLEELFYHVDKFCQAFEPQGIAARGKTSVNWFYGLKLHLVVNECGELLNITVTPGITHDRKPVFDLLKGLTDGSLRS